MQNMNFEQIWKDTIAKYQLQNENKLFINEIIQPTKLINILNDIAIISTNKSANLTLLEDQKDKLENCLSIIIDKTIKIQFVDSNSQSEYLSSVTKQESNLNQNINADITYKTYVVGNFNKNAFKLANQLSETSTSVFNPIFIYSKTGLGKTHLLTAMINEFNAKHPNKTICYLETQAFIREVFACFEEKNNSSLVEKLKNKYCSYDILVIDDIQYLSEKTKTNEILFTIFNYLTNNKKIVIMSSDRAPHELNGFEDRMISRFSSGISCRIEEPDDDSLKIIISRALSSQNIYLTDDATMLIIDFCDRDIRKLLGLINKIIFFVEQKTGLLDKDEIRNILEVDNKVIGYNKKNTFAHPSKIIETVAKIYNVKVADLVGNSRKKNIVTARHVVMYIMREYSKLQLKDIGSFLGNRDHTTILSGAEKIKGLVISDKEFSKLVSSIIKKLN